MIKARIRNPVTGLFYFVGDRPYVFPDASCDSALTLDNVAWMLVVMTSRLPSKTANIHVSGT